MRGPRPFRIFLMVILALTPLAQPFWFIQAWRVIDAVIWPVARSLLQELWVVTALIVLATALDLLLGQLILRRVFGPWGRAGARLWLIASCLGFLAVVAVGGVEWLSRPAMAILPAPQAASSCALHSGTASGARLASSRHSWRACIVCRSASRDTPQAMKARHTLDHPLFCM
jgi:hypothetical protein